MTIFLCTTEWLQGYPDDVQRAFCKVCKAILRAHKHDLTCHARTARHLKKMQDYKNEGGGGEQQLFQMMTEEVVSFPQKEIVSHGLVGEIGIEIDTSGIFPDNGMVGGSDNNKQPKIMKMAKAIIKQREAPAPKQVSRKRIVRITAADVLTAIENNEFTGYELLQIVKKIVPKL